MGVKIISSSRIQVEIDGELCELSRYCPHQGADLAQGFVKDGKLRCPWHNLPFDKHGKQPCSKMKNLKCFSKDVDVNQA